MDLNCLLMFDHLVCNDPANSKNPKSMLSIILSIFAAETAVFNSS